MKAYRSTAMATPTDDVETALEYSFEENALKKKIEGREALRERALREAL